MHFWTRKDRCNVQRHKNCNETITVSKQKAVSTQNVPKDGSAFAQQNSFV